MKFKILKLGFIFLTGISSPIELYSQESINSTGGNTSGSGGSASYSVGQTFYFTNSGINGSASEGVQQAYEISIVTGIAGTQVINLIVSAYPNPTNNDLIIDMGEFDIANLSFQLFDLNGKLLKSDNISSKQVKISMIIFPSATYFLKIINRGREIKSFKIVKN